MKYQIGKLLVRAFMVIGIVILIVGPLYAADQESTKKLNKDWQEVTIPRALCDGFYEITLDIKVQNPENISIYRIDNDGNPDFKAPVAFKYKADGDYGKVIFKINGVGTEVYDIKVIDGRYSKKNKDIAAAEEKYRVFFNRPLNKKSDVSDIPADANLIGYGAFENIDAKTGWPAGMPGSIIKRCLADGCTIQKIDTPYGRNCIKIIKPKNNRSGFISFHCAVQGGKNYYFTYAEKYEIAPDREALTYATVSWYDRDGKQITRKFGSVITGHETFNQAKKGFDWKIFTKLIKAPENAAFMIMKFHAQGSDGYVLVKNVTIRPQSYTGIPVDAERTRIKQTTYQPLDILEQLNISYLTPHVKWLLPNSEAPSILFLVTQHGTVADMRKREIVELLQRMSIADYRYIPLLRKMLTPPRMYLGMADSATYSDELEPYTLMCIEEADPSNYDMTLIYGLDFKGKQPELTKLLMNVLKKGKGLLLLDCENIPEELKGRAIQTLPGFLLMPAMRKLPDAAVKNICSLGKVDEGRVAVVNKNDNNALKYYPCVPKEYSLILYNDYYGRSFPYWEYMYIPLIKAIEWTAGKSSSASFTEYKQDALKNTMDFKVKSDSVLNARLKMCFSSLFKEKGPEVIKDISLKDGENIINIPIPPELSGGTSVVDYWLLAAQDDNIYDFGAGRIDVPESCQIKEIAFNNADLCYKNDEPVNLKIELENAPAGAELQCMVEDTNNRIVWRMNEKAASSVTFSFVLQPPYTTLYRVLIKVIKDGKVLAQSMKEFSMPFRYRDLLDLQAYVWGIKPQTFSLWRELGFDSVLCSYQWVGSTKGLFYGLNNANLRPLAYGSGTILNDYKAKYMTDTNPDPVRSPCYSDMEHWRKVRDIIHTMMEKGKYKFYGIREHLLQDESYMSGTVCYSEHCLAGFRKYLQERYQSLDDLNKEWNTAFKKWEDVIPIQKNEVDLKNKNNMARWLDHKIFMNRVFAMNWVGFTKQYINEIIPDSKVGLSGTQNPGYSYDWSVMMKTVDYLAYYGGIQTDLIRSFSRHGLVSGQWGGGYVPAHITREEYERCRPWVGMFRDNNAYCFFHGGTGTCLYGDLSVSRNIQIASEEIKELKSGTAKMLLCAKAEETSVAIFHSQASMFAAMVTVGNKIWENSLLSWKTLLNDLRYNYSLISEDELEKTGLNNEKFKVLVLPAAFCISEKQTENIRRFVSGGGVVVADFGVGYFDGSGKRIANKRLDEVFGVDRSNSILGIEGCDVRIKAAPEFGIGEYSMKISAGEKDFKTVSGKAMGTSGNNNTPLMVCNKFGKGNAFLFNISVDWYKNIIPEGDAGEVSKVSLGPEELAEKLRNITSEILQFSGLNPLCRITLDGKVYPCTTVSKQDGGIKYLGLISESEERNNIAPEKAVSALITMPFKSHVYSVRDGRYLGNTDKIQSRIIPAVAQLYAFLPYQVTGIEINGKGEYSLGEVVNLEAKIKASSNNICPHVIRVELQDPSGKIDPVYSQNIYLPDGNGHIKFQFAINSRPGKWKLTVKDIASAFKVEKQIILKQQ